MIPNYLLIQTQSIYWIGELSLRNIFISGIWVSVFFLILTVVLYSFRIWKRGIELQKSFGDIPHISSIGFESQAGGLLRQYIAHLYLPQHSVAHTAYDISQYVDAPDILTTLGTLERAQYSGVHLDSIERGKVVLLLERLKRQIL